MDEVGRSDSFPLWSIGGVVLLALALLAGVAIGIWTQRGPYAELESELAVEHSAVEDLESELAVEHSAVEELGGQLSETEAALLIATSAVEELQGQLSESEAALLIATSTTTSTRPRTRSITVTYDLVGRSAYTISGDQCQGRGFFSTIEENHQMVLTDGTGSVLSTARLGQGSPHTASDSATLGVDYDESFCRFEFTFSSVPIDRDFYTVDDNSDFGSISFSRSDFLSGDPGITLET